MRTLGRRNSVWMSEAAIVEVEAAATASKGAIIRATMVATAELTPWVVLLGVRLQKAAIIGAEAVIVIKAAATVIGEGCYCGCVCKRLSLMLLYKPILLETRPVCC